MGCLDRTDSKKMGKRPRWKNSHTFLQTFHWPKGNLFLKEINGFMLNVTDYCVISPVTGEGAFLPSGTLYIVFLRHESEAQGLSAHCNKKVGKHF